MTDERIELGSETTPTDAIQTEQSAADVPAMYSLAAEIRAVEEGHVARVLPDGSILVKADSRPGSYRVWIRRVDDGVVTFGCTCSSGAYRRLPVPCKHAALAGRRLEREGLAIWQDGLWHLRHRTALRAALAATIQPRTDRRPEPAGSPAGNQPSGAEHQEDRTAA